MTLTEAIDASGMTQRDVAKKADMREATISAMTRGFTVALPEAERLSRVLGHRVESHELVAPATRAAMAAWAKRQAKDGGK